MARSPRARTRRGTVPRGSTSTTIGRALLNGPGTRAASSKAMPRPETAMLKPTRREAAEPSGPVDTPWRMMAQTACRALLSVLPQRAAQATSRRVSSGVSREWRRPVSGPGVGWNRLVAVASASASGSQNSRAGARSLAFSQRP